MLQPELMRCRMKKTGQFFFTFVPFLIVMGLQFLAMFFMMGVTMMVECLWRLILGTGASDHLWNEILIELWTSENSNTWLMVMFAILSISIFALWYYIKYNGNYLPKPRAVFHPLSILGIVMLVPGMQLLSTYIISLTSALFPGWLKIYEDLIESAGLDNGLTFGLFLYSVILAPISEELVFRGVTLRQAQKYVPFWAANLLQALLFGVFHMNMIQGIYAFCLGLILGYVCEKSGSIYNAVLLHMLFNFWGTSISQFIAFGDSSFAFVFWLIFAAAMTAGGLIVFQAGTKRTMVYTRSLYAPEFSPREKNSDSWNRTVPASDSNEIKHSEIVHSEIDSDSI